MSTLESRLESVKVEVRRAWENALLPEGYRLDIFYSVKNSQVCVADICWFVYDEFNSSFGGLCEQITYEEDLNENELVRKILSEIQTAMNTHWPDFILSSD